MKFMRHGKDFPPSIYSRSTIRTLIVCVMFFVIATYFFTLFHLESYTYYHQTRSEMSGIPNDDTSGFRFFGAFIENNEPPSSTIIIHSGTFVEEEEAVQPGFVVSSEGCYIPDMNPFDPEILRYIYPVKERKCDRKIKMIFSSDHDKLYFNKSVLVHYGIVNETNNYSCCYQALRRNELNFPEEDNQWADSWFTYSTECHLITEDDMLITEEFIRIQCTKSVGGNESVFHTDFHAFVPRKKHVEKRVTGLIDEKKDKKVSVLVVGIDGVSRLNMIRMLPKTRKFLLKNLNAIEMYGYNKVADNSFPNLIPVFTGKSEDELDNTCHHTNESFFDDCSFIWDNYSANGYRTSFVEDTAFMGFFTYMKMGFAMQPVDYYPRPIFYNMEDEIGRIPDSNCVMCFGGRPVVDFYFDYVKKLCREFKNDLHFSFTWFTTLTHDYFQYASLADPYVLNFFKKMHKENVFKNTVVIFMSDHGVRWGEFRQTYQGKMEERLPFLTFIFPEWFKQKYPTAVKNVMKNSRRLSSPYDLHETLKDLLDTSTIEEDEIKTRELKLSTAAPNLERGISFFLPIPPQRTCNDSGISDHWCACHNTVKISTNDTATKAVSDFIVKNLNRYIANHANCANMTLKEVKDIRQHSSNKENGTATYLVTLSVNPSDGLFEATVRKHGERMILVDHISRVNLYGAQSDCVSGTLIKKYCYCIQ